MLGYKKLDFLSVFQNGVDEVDSGFLIEMNFRKRKDLSRQNGRMDIWLHEGMLLETETAKTLRILICDAYHWMGALEQPRYPRKECEPSDRTDKTYMPLGYSNVDILNLSNGGRFLSIKRPLKVQGYAHNILKTGMNGSGYMAIHCDSDDPLGVSRTLTAIVTDLGVPREGVDRIVGDIFQKL